MVTVDGQGGSDRLHLTGQLNKDTGTPVSGSKDQIVLKNENYDAGYHTGELTIDITGIEKYTDELAGKKVIELTKENLQKVNGKEGEYTVTGGAAFTDYVLKEKTSGIKSLKINSANAFLSKLLIDEFKTDDDDGTASPQGISRT